MSLGVHHKTRSRKDLVLEGLPEVVPEVLEWFLVLLKGVLMMPDTAVVLQDVSPLRGSRGS